jgi:hypothetical protein
VFLAGTCFISSLSRPCFASLTSGFLTANTQFALQSSGANMPHPWRIVGLALGSRASERTDRPDLLVGGDVVSRAKETKNI